MLKNYFEKIKLFLNNFFKIKIKNDNINYNINFANPIKRFLAFIIDTIIIYSVIICLIFIIIKKDIIQNIDIEKETEISFNVNSNNEISDIKNFNIEIDKETSDKIIVPKNKEERFDKLNNLIYNKVYNNKLCKYIILLTPIFYNILYLSSKKRATFGQQIFNLVVVKKNGQQFTFSDIINRVFLFSICKIIFLLPFTIIIPIFFTKNKITLYDYYTDTYVLEIK